MDAHLQWLELSPRKSRVAGRHAERVEADVLTYSDNDT